MPAQKKILPEDLTEFKSLALPGFYVSLSLAVVTLITFIIAFLTPPLSGPYCVANCYEYPYTDIASRFPRYYLWMYPAMVSSILYFIFMVFIHYYAGHEKKIFGHISVAFSLMAALILTADYFIQVSVIQPALLKGEFDGISILTQYNSHGIFIAMEEFGYLMMSFSFLFAAFIFSNNIKPEKTIKRIFAVNFILVIISLAVYSIIYGIHREYRFEVAVIPINFFTLIINGILISRLFYRIKSAGFIR